MGRDELESPFFGYGYTPYFVEGAEPRIMHQQMTEALETVLGEIRAIQDGARGSGEAGYFRWPMILRTPKGWTGPKEVDGHKIEGSWRAHRCPSMFTGIRPI